MSIWDTFSHSSGATRNGDNGDVACDHYHRYEEDVAVMADLGIGAYRFSVAWARIQPTGTGPANRRGVDHYRRLVEALNRVGIAPVLTLYHWDLPQALEDAGGWANRDTAEWFAEYAEIVHRALGDSVALWITLNEPWVAAWLGYGAGIHAPGRTDDRLALAASHHLLLAHGLAREVIGSRSEVGISLNLQPTRSASDRSRDVRAARLADLHANALFLDPLFGRGYPPDLLEHYRGVTDFNFVRDGDLECIARSMDFLGVNYYRPLTVTGEPRSEQGAELPGHLGAWTVVPPGVDVTAMGWPIEPEGLTETLVGVHREYAPARIFVTENGAAFDDRVDATGRVTDPARTSFLRSHVEAARAAIRAGVPLEGFFVWSLLDNFEWAEGYSKRFGLVHVDFETLRRTPKESAWWYRGVAGSGGSGSGG